MRFKRKRRRSALPEALEQRRLLTVDLSPRVLLDVQTVRPSAVFAADLDNDGDLDFLSASVGDSKIAWYENEDALGTAGAQRVITNEARQTSYIFAADLDNDGWTDVLSATTSDDTVAWYRNEGDGEFGSRRVITDSANGASSVVAADLNDDGQPDIVVASVFDDTVAWFPNLGGGQFGAENVLTTTANGVSLAIVGDVDADGDPDVVSASRGNGIEWFENGGSGKLQRSAVGE